MCPNLPDVRIYPTLLLQEYIGEFQNILFFLFQYVVPDKETTYLCTGFQMPDLGGKHHMTEVINYLLLFNVRQLEKKSI